MKENESYLPKDLRAEFLQKAKPLIGEYIGAALGMSDLKSTNSEARSEVFDVIKSVILKADDPVPVIDLMKGDAAERVDAVLTQVAGVTLHPMKESG